jgi:hypothetical protein
MVIMMLNTIIQDDQASPSFNDKVFAVAIDESWRIFMVFGRFDVAARLRIL